jgi:hypothetical protein
MGKCIYLSKGDLDTLKMEHWEHCMDGGISVRIGCERGTDPGEKKIALRNIHPIDISVARLFNRWILGTRLAVTK